jgi:hypothetical protein
VASAPTQARYGAKVTEVESMEQVMIDARVKPVLELSDKS